MAQRNERRRYRSSRSTKKSGKRVIAWFMIVLAVAALGGIGGASAWYRSTRPQMDAATMCPSAGPVAVHAILLDRSDPITPLQAERLRQVVGAAIENASVNERIDLYVLAGDGTQAVAPVVSLCRPKSDGNGLYENRARIPERYAARFKKPLDDALASMMVPVTAQSSPIMESVKAVCIAAFGEMEKSAPARLTVASDMIQFSPLLNHYKRRDFDEFAATPAYKQVLADCHGASVKVLYLVRARDVRVQDRKHQLFWERFFDHENAIVMSIEPI
jgi:hypothetical protein